MRRLHSPNQDARPPGTELALVVIHGISLPPGQFGGGHIDRLFLNALNWDEHEYFRTIKGLKVSSHVLIERCGRVTQYVPFTARAWHAGESRFRGRERCNDFSVGIELEGSDELAYEDAQYDALGLVLAALRAAYPQLDAEHVAGHCHIAPGRKTDPGEGFDWPRLGDLLGTAPGWCPRA